MRPAPWRARCVWRSPFGTSRGAWWTTLLSSTTSARTRSIPRCGPPSTPSTRTLTSTSSFRSTTPTRFARLSASSPKRTGAGTRAPRGGQVGALDGVDFWQKNPDKAVKNPRRFYVERKGHFCLLCLAVCDALRRFTYFDVSFAAGSHDSLAWAGTNLGQKLQEGGLPRPYFLNGDSAFTCANHMVVPMNSTDFDFYQSSNRSVL